MKIWRSVEIVEWGVGTAQKQPDGTWAERTEPEQERFESEPSLNGAAVKARVTSRMKHGRRYPNPAIRTVDMWVEYAELDWKRFE